MKNIFTSLFAIITVAFTSQAQNTWTQKADFGGGPRCWTASFSIGDKGYVGVGYGYYKDFWVYDPQSDVWTQKADFGGQPRGFGVYFNIDDKGYVGAGASQDTSYHTYKDFWEYDPLLNVWTQKSDVGGPARLDAVSFNIGNKGYVGSGVDGYGNYFKDFWEYDPFTDSWSQKQDFPATGRASPVGFGIGTKGYVGTGYAGYPDYSYKKDFWEYDQVADNWTQKADFGGSGREGAFGFSMSNKGYVGMGYQYDGGEYYYNDFWEYNPQSDTWMQKADFAGNGRIGAAGFSIGNKGYLGTGISSENNALYYYSDFWEYSSKPDGIAFVDDSECLLLIFPNPARNQFVIELKLSDGFNAVTKIEILNPLGQIVHSQNAIMLNGKLQLEIQLGNAAGGMYLVKVVIGDHAYTTQIDFRK